MNSTIINNKHLRKIQALEVILNDKYINMYGCGMEYNIGV